MNSIKPSPSKKLVRTSESTSSTVPRQNEPDFVPVSSQHRTMNVTILNLGDCLPIKEGFQDCFDGR